MPFLWAEGGLGRPNPAYAASGDAHKTRARLQVTLALLGRARKRCLQRAQDRKADREVVGEARMVGEKLIE
jgi:hypothetical protein